MRLEQLPLILGGVVALVGLLLILDGIIPDRGRPTRERRRRQRRERDRAGETLVGLGAIAMAAALLGRDTWRYGTVAVLIGAALLAIGMWLNRSYIRELLLFRGAARRGEKRNTPRIEAAAPAPPAPDPTPPVRRPPPPPTPHAVERERPISASAGFADRSPSRPDEADAPGPEATPRRPRIR